MMEWNGRAGEWFASRGNTIFSGKNFAEVWLFAMGYGCDQAASLRYLMDEINRDEKC